MAANRDSTQSSVGEEGSRKLQPRGYGPIAKGSTLKRVRSASMVKELPLPSLSVRTEVRQRFAFRLR
jgi:hypothetical protein